MELEFEYLKAIIDKIQFESERKTNWMNRFHKAKSSPIGNGNSPPHGSVLSCFQIKNVNPYVDEVMGNAIKTIVCNYQ